MTILRQGVQVDVELRLPIQKVWNALKNMDNVAPKISLDFNHLKGNGGVGSVSLLQFADGSSEKERLDRVCNRTYTLISTVVSKEAAKGPHEYTKIVALQPSKNGTATIARWRAEYVPVAEKTLCRSASNNALSLFKALETYLSSDTEEFA